MTKTITPTDPLTALDDDLRAACLDRDKAWRAVVMKDNAANKKAYAEAGAKVDELLDMRHEMAVEDAG